MPDSVPGDYVVIVGQETNNNSYLKKGVQAPPEAPVPVDYIVIGGQYFINQVVAK